MFLLKEITKIHQWMLKKHSSNLEDSLNTFSILNFSLAGLFAIYLFDDGLRKSLLDVSDMGIDKSIVLTTLIVLIIGALFSLVYVIFSTIFEIWTERKFTIPVKYKLMLSFLCIPLPVFVYKPCFILIKKMIRKIN